MELPALPPRGTSRTTHELLQRLHEGVRIMQARIALSRRLVKDSRALLDSLTVARSPVRPLR